MRRWAAEWLGGDYYWDAYACGVGLDTAEGQWLHTDADLAEAVRVKYVDTFPVSAYPAPEDPWPGCCLTWGISGPLAFMRAVQEVIDG